MDCFRITGGVPLIGTAQVSGAKNAALPILAATILAHEPVIIHRAPDVTDVNTLSLLLGTLGVEVKRGLDGALRVHTVDSAPCCANDSLVRRMRASFCVLGPLVARRGRAKVSLPGGCNLGTRPVDLHLSGLEALGADVRIEHGYVLASARRLRGARINVRGPHGPTVTGTANLLMAATLADGVTVLDGAALEPEVVDLGQFLNKLGAKITGLGTPTIRVEGVQRLTGGEHTVIPDRIEAATLLIAAAITFGDVTVQGAQPDHLAAVLDVLGEAGCQITTGENYVRLETSCRPASFCAIARPYPGVPTDVQAQLMALAAVAQGTSRIRDEVFPDRFWHVAELNRLGARITRSGCQASIAGARMLTGARVIASDLRASAALVLAALAARGTSVVERIDHLDRGYQRLQGKLQQLGARIERGRGKAAASVSQLHRSSLVSTSSSLDRS